MHYLFRGVREDEFQERVLKPKKQGAFAQHAMTPIKTPIITGESLESAARNHQYETIKTSGVSTAVSFQSACGYATKQGTKSGIVAVIDRFRLTQFGVYEYDVTNCGDVRKPEDQEIILYTKEGEPLPSDIVIDWISIKAETWRDQGSKDFEKTKRY